ncbi:hypothetical protein DRO61_04525 [Candidatus Bathyarchaeota archaeon]|nr:MAG: hypothetical protein DRO61_04525 [Candidatus Bathyarchaeota archaeon]
MKIKKDIFIQTKISPMSPESICNFRENIFLEKRESYGALMVTSIVRSRFKSHRLHQESPPIRLILGF